VCHIENKFEYIKAENVWRGERPQRSANYISIHYITLHWSYLEWLKYKTAKPLLIHGVQN